MASIVVLVRHGKAQAREAGVDDFGRTLTAAGRRALAATLPDTLAPLGTMPEFMYGTTEIWSSDAVRAMETAEEVAFVLGVSKINKHRCLYEQRVEKFLQEAIESEADVVVAVGHNPFIEQAAQALCGGTVPFKTGGIGIFDLSAYAGEAYDGTLRSFSQGPRTDDWKTLVKLEKAIADSASAVQENMEAFLASPEDVEALHDMRVSIRSLRSELAFVEPFQRKAQNKLMQKTLRDLVVRTSRLRELDVLTETVSSSEHTCEELEKMCAKMRRKECDKLLALIGNKKVLKDTTRFLRKQFNNIKWRDDVERFGLPRERVATNFELMTMEFEAEYLACDYRDVEATHKLRKNAKRVRYTAREFGDLIGPAAEGVPAAMEEVQDELGALCDARVNCELIDSMPRKKLSDEADTALAALKQDQLDIIEAILLATEADETEAPAESDERYDEPEAFATEEAADAVQDATAADAAIDEHYDEPEAFALEDEAEPVTPEAAVETEDFEHYDEPGALVDDDDDVDDEIDD